MSDDKRLADYQARLQSALDAMQKMRGRLEAAENRRSEPIAVIGVSCRFPGDANDPDSFWRLLENGVDAIGEVPAERWDIDSLYDPDPQKPGKMSARWGGFLKDIDQFDAQFFGISPREARSMDPQQRLLLEAGWQALEHAGLNPVQLNGSQTGVFVGITVNDYLQLQNSLQSLDQIDAYRITGNSLNSAAGRLSYFLGFHGPSIAVDTACSSSLVAVHLACQSLRNGESIMALAGGVNLILSPQMSIGATKASMLAPDGRCKTFDARADGFVRSEGCGVVVLKRLSDAQNDGDNILAVIRGSAVNQDGFSSGLTVPNKLAQEAVIRTALRNAGVKPADIQYVEAHGTGTSLGDPIEVRALTSVLSEGRSAQLPFRLGSVKTNIGHAESAAGIAGLIKTVLALHHGIIPPHLHFHNPSPMIDWNKTPAVIPTKPVDWTGPHRFASVSAFGASGTNAHIVLETAPESKPVSSFQDRPLHLLTISAKNSTALKESAERIRNYLSTCQASFRDVCHSANTGRAHFNHRIALTASTAEEMESRLASFIASEDLSSYGIVEPGSTPKIAFLFTGHGSQYVNMGRSLYETSPVFRQAVQECEALLQAYLDVPISKMMYPEPEEEVSLATLWDGMKYTQPAQFVLAYALVKLWASWGIVPGAVLGHSVGEYAAACAAGMMMLADGIKLVAARGRLMEALPEKGVMTAVFADEAMVAKAMSPYAGRVSMAVINGSTNIVISGDAPAVEAIQYDLTKLEIKSKRLDVAQASHSPLVDPMLDEFESIATSIQYFEPKIEYVSSLTGEPALQIDSKYWRTHQRQTVRFAAGLQTLIENGYNHLIEIGPAPTLITIAQRNLDGVNNAPEAYPSLRKGQDDWGQMLNSLAGLYIRGAAVDWHGFDQPYPRRRMTLPTYPFQRQSYWITPAPKRHGSSRGNLLHPLLGTRLHTAAKEIIFENELSSLAPAFLADHVVQGQVILPASAYMEMFVAAGREVLRGNHSFVIEDLTIHTPLILIEAEMTGVQTVVSKNSEGVIACQIFGQNRAGDQWQVHASAVVRTNTETLAPVSLSEIRSRCTETLSVEGHYQQLADRGLGFGPSFQGVTHLQLGQGEALARIEPKDNVASETSSYSLHPAILDAALQAIAALLPIGDKTYLPLSIDSVHALDRIGPAIWVQSTLTEDNRTGDDLIAANVNIFDDDGRILVALQGFTMKHMPRTQEDSWLYEVQWQNDVNKSTRVIRDRSGSWLIFGGESQVNDHLLNRFRENFHSAELVVPGNAFAGINGHACQVDPMCADDFHKLLEAHGTCNGIVYAWALDHTDFPDQQSRLCSGLLYLVQALVAAGQSCPIWVVTQGAQAAHAQIIDPDSSTLWGLCKVINQEHPELPSRLIDLDPGERVEDNINNLWMEISAPDAEDQVVYRDNERLIPRLVHTQAEQGSSIPNGPIKLTVSERGVLENLAFEKLGRRSPGPGEVEIQVLATGIGFRDVLNTLGMYPGGGELGSECAGVITAVGPGVENIRIGEAVIAVALGSFATYVITPSKYVVRKPDQLSFPEATTIPSAFLTTQYALHKLAKIKAGDRVLIHAAAGGVGLAAVQLGQQAGAEIFATAGSPAKREMLKALGIQYVLDSRTLDFAEEIIKITDGKGIDIVLNSLADEFITQSVAVLADHGRFIEIGKRGIWTEERFKQVKPEAFYAIVDLLLEAQQNDELIPALFEELMPDFENGTLKPLPLHAYPAPQVIDAFRTMSMGRHSGKLVIAQESRAFAIHPDATYLITGAFGGLGIATAEWLVDQGARHLALIGRNAPREQAQASLQKLAQAGVEPKILQADVSQRQAMIDVFEQMNTMMPPLKGVIHAVGVLDDGVLSQQNWERFEKVFAPKVQGGWILHELTKGMALDFFVLYSSAVSLIGSAGQANHVAASTFLDALAYYRRAQGLPGLSIGWGPWEQIGAAAEREISERLLGRGIESIPPAQGIEALSRVMHNPAFTHVGVVPINWTQFAQQASSPFFTRLINKSQVKSAKAVASADQPRQDSDLWKRLENAPESKRANLLLGHVREQALKVLNLPADFPLEQRQPLQELGLDSLMAVELRNLLRKGLPLERALPATLVFDYPTPEALTRYLMDELFVKSETIAQPVQAMKIIEQVDLADLSDEEAEALLLTELNEINQQKTGK